MDLQYSGLPMLLVAIQNAKLTESIQILLPQTMQMLELCIQATSELEICLIRHSFAKLGSK